MKYILLIAALALHTIAMGGIASATPSTPPQHIRFLSQKELDAKRDVIQSVERYLTNIDTIISNFTQIAPDGSLASGKFYLKRPGKMRWQYNPPTPILMVSNGRQLVYYDYELEQVSHMSLDSTLVGFLAHDNITFDKTVGITEISKGSGVVRLTLAKRDKPTEGQLMLEFSDKPLTLRNMVIRDATNQITSIALNDAKFGVELDDGLFVFRDPRKPRGRK